MKTQVVGGNKARLNLDKTRTSKPTEDKDNFSG